MLRRSAVRSSGGQRSDTALSTRSGTSTHSARPVFATAAETRYRHSRSSTSHLNMRLPFLSVGPGAERLPRTARRGHTVG
jgi:hypothetical protein